MEQNCKVESKLAFIRTDSALSYFYEEYITKGNYPNEEESVNNLHFLAVFAIGCSKMGLEEQAELWGQRVDYYSILLQWCGYRYGRYWVGRKGRDFRDLLTKAFYGIGV